MSDQNQYANWTPADIGVLLTEYEAEWKESLPWPILELVQRFVSDRLVDRKTIDPLIATIERWSHAYPLEVFPDPPYQEHGSTVDACSARMGRHIIGRLMELIPPELVAAVIGDTK